jgi:hypothetical protein
MMDVTEVMASKLPVNWHYVPWKLKWHYVPALRGRDVAIAASTSMPHSTRPPRLLGSPRAIHRGSPMRSSMSRGRCSRATLVSSAHTQRKPGRGRSS